MRTAPVPDIPPLPGMNPGTIVAGGGGEGGGDGGDGGNGGGDDESAGGANGGDNADGDGKGAGACGQGANGGCPNCHNNVAAGDPVDVTSGKVFTVPKTDLFLPGTFNLQLLRSYSSSNREVDIGMGFGWVHSLAWRLEDEGRFFTLRTGDGQRKEIPKLEKAGSELRAGGWGVYKLRHAQLLRPGNEFVHAFSPVGPGSRIHKLDFVEYRKRGSIQLKYDEAGRLIHAVDTVGRVILFEQTPDGRIASISVPDPHGRTIVFARYAYDSAGNLVAVADADGNTMRYAYDDDHRLTRLEYPSGLVFYFRYDKTGRCVETWGDYPGAVDPALARDLPAVLSDGQTRARGIYHNKLLHRAGYTEVTDSVRVQRFFEGPGGTVAKAVDGRGGVTTRTYTEEGWVASLTDPSGATVTYTYDELGEVVSETDPNGHSCATERDGGGRPLALVDAAGGVAKVRRDRDCFEIEEVKDQAGGTLRLVLDARGMETEVTDERGERHLIAYDLHYNWKSYTTPVGAKWQYTWDYWGRCVARQDPLGNVTQYSYSDAGYLVSAVDALARTVRWQRDSMGKIVRASAADGTSESYDYGGLNWLARIVRADGTSVRYFHNREGWITALENERGERHTFEYNSAGQLIAETDFHGATTRYGYDPVGRLKFRDEGHGKFEYSRTKAGQLTAIEAPDGSTIEYTHNPRGELVAARTGDTEFSWKLDPVGRVLSEQITVGDATYVIESTRTAAGDRTLMRTSLGHEQQARRDASGFVSELWSGGQRVLSLARSVLGLPTRQEFARGGAVVDTHDRAYRLQRRTVVGPGTQLLSGQPEWVGRQKGDLERLYEYTPVNEVRSVSSSDGTSIEYEYDLRNHVRERRTNGIIDAEYRADAAENYVGVGVSATPTSIGKGNQLTGLGEFEYRYDDRGNLIEKRRGIPGKPPEVTKFEWNAWGLLKAVESPDGTRTEFEYDAFARRLAKKTVREGKVVEAHHYVWDLVSMVHDVKVDRDGKPDDVRTYLYLDDGEDTPNRASRELRLGALRPGPQRRAERDRRPHGSTRGKNRPRLVRSRGGIARQRLHAVRLSRPAGQSRDRPALQPIPLLRP